MERIAIGSRIFFLSRNLGYSFEGVALMGSTLGARMSILTIGIAALRFTRSGGYLV